jgi:aromatic-L-amino-acid/L-tryptophan decarboxylase
MTAPATTPTDPIRLSSLESAAAMHADDFRELGHRLVDRIADFLGDLRERPVTPAEPPDRVRAALSAADPLPEYGSDPHDIVASTAELLLEHSLFNGHPRFLGYVTSSPAPIGMLADLLAAAVNPNVGAWALSPMATEIEAQAVRWIAELIGYPAGAGGLFVSGGNMANFVGFLAARAETTAGAVRAGGIREVPRLRVYATGETHTWVQKATDLFGLGTDAIRWIPTDAELRMDPSALAAAIADDRRNGLHPMLVAATAGSVSTGSIDPLPAIAGVCRAQQVWMHVDGAYGGFAAAADDVPDDLRGIRLADSVAIDPHKWLYAPLEAGCVLVRDPETLRNAFSYHPPYYHFGEESLNYYDLGPQNSRGFRALKVWMALRQAGRSGYAASISTDISLSRHLFELLKKEAEIEPVTQSLSITTFRYLPPELRADVGTDRVDRYLDQLNEELLDRIQRSGEAFVSNAVVRGRYLLRACIVNFNTTRTDIEALPTIVTRLGRLTHRALGGPGPT